MESRGQKRTETVDALPADKRACNALERPSTSNSSPQTPIIAAQEGRDADMETSSSTSGSTRSEGDGERDSMNGSCDSENNFRDYYRHRPWSDQSKFKKVLLSLSEEVDESGQLALLTELCELLSFCSDSSLSSLMADSLSPILVRLARHEGNPEIMLLSVRAITYLCDVNPRSSGFLVRHDAVPALCQRLMAIEYLDVAEQCLLALEKISREQPLACLNSGAIMAVLSYIDFFSTSVQRLALSTLVNICKKLSSENPSFFMDAVPILCNLLQYEDRQIVESVTTCLIRMVEQVCHSSDMLDEVCKHGLIQHALHLIGLNSRTTLCQPTYIGLIGLLVKLASGSIVATKTLFELDLSVTVKDMLSTYDLSHGTQSIPMVEGYHGQMHEVLKLLNELLPTITDDQDDQLKTDKKTFLLNHPDILQKFGVDLLPVLIQVVNSGVNLFICYGCLSVVNKLVHFSTCDALPSLLRTANFSSFLAGVFTRKNHHLILLALQIVETIMLKLPHVFLHSFIKEGVLFAICALLSPDTELFPGFDGMQLGSDGTQNSIVPNVRKCPCFAFDAGQSSSTPEKGTCKLQKDAVQHLAKHIWTTYFATEATNPERGVTDALQKLRTLAGVLTNLVNESRTDVSSSQKEEDIYDLLSQIMSKLNEKDSISTFEFVESGITKALVNYLLNGRHLVVEEENIEADQLYIMEKRFEVFGQLLLPSADTSREEFPLLTLTRRLQNALSSLENLPVVSSHISKSRNSYATVPFGRCTSYPCLKVHFVRENGESLVRDYAEDLATVDPFLPLDAIEEYLWPRVSYGETKNLALGSKDSKENHSLRSDSPSDLSTSKGKSADVVPTEMLHIHKLEEEMPRSLCSPTETSSFEQKNMDSADVTDLHTDPTEQEEHTPVRDDGSKNTDGETTKPKLLLFLEGQQLNSELSLYQSIIGQQTVCEHDSIASVSLWTHTYRITYRCLANQSSHAKHCHDKAQYSLSSKRALFFQPIPFLSRVFVSEIELERLGPSYDVLFLLKSLEEINRLRFHLKTRERMDLFAEGKTDDLESLNIPINEVCHKEFVNSKLTEKLEQQMRYPTTVSVGGMPAWCTQLMAWCPFLFGFEARYKYFHLAAFGRLPVQTNTSSHSNVGGPSGSHSSHGSILRKKFLVHRNEILESAAKMMELHARQKVLLEVEYNEEVGSGLGPTLEFYTLVCHEFQRSGLGMWRDDHVLEDESSGVVVSPFGLFPRPWSPSATTSSSSTYSEVIKKFSLLGQMVAKALQDGRILDLPFSKTFYKLILGKNLSVFDVQSIDPAFGRTLIEFQTIVERKRYSSSRREENLDDIDVSFRSTKIEDLCLDFTLPGYPDYVVESASDLKSVNHCNLEEYVKVMVDATLKSGISRQVEAFKSGFNQVFPIRHLKVFTEEELERLLCGEHVLWKSDELTDHIKFDHGYTISSPPIINLLGIMQEFDHEQQRAFLQFVTGAPRLPTGGLASLNPKLTIVRKHCSKGVDEDLPSVMTCANYLKLPPYSSKEVMKEKLLYAIIEGQGSFHLS